MGEKLKDWWFIIFCCFIMIIAASSVGHYLGNKEGYGKGMNELSEYKRNTSIYYSEWNKLDERYYSKNHYSEHLTIYSTRVHATRIGEDYYSLDWYNYNADEDFSIYCILPTKENSVCKLRVSNSACLRSFNSIDHNCTKEYVYEFVV